MILPHRNLSEPAKEYEESQTRGISRKPWTGSAFYRFGDIPRPIYLPQ